LLDAYLNPPCARHLIISLGTNPTSGAEPKRLRLLFTSAIYSVVEGDQSRLRRQFTEMHTFEHHQSIVEEYSSMREPWRRVHLVYRTRAAATSFFKDVTVYEEYLELLHAA
jgi:hypothetical protein